MRNRISVLVLGLVALVFMVGATGGCGSLGRYNESTYYYPDWTPSGEIICVKNVTTYEKQKSWWFDGGTSAPVAQAYYITTMSIAGTNETDIKTINGIGQVVASPLGNYIAYTEDNNIKIINTAGTAVNTIDCGEAINSMDWGPDEARIAYSGETTNNLFVVNVASSTITQISTNAATVAWGVGDKVAYGFLYLINYDGTGNNYLVDGGKPQIMTSGQVLYFGDLISAGTYRIQSIFPSGTGESTVIPSYSRSTLKISPNNLRIVGGDLYQGNIKGIWLMNIDGTGEQQLK